MKRLLSCVLLFALIVCMAACSPQGKTYDLGNKDRAKAFYNKYMYYVENFGEGKAVDGTLYGTAVARLYDFTGDGNPEMLLGYSSVKDGKVDSIAVFGFDMGLAEVLNEKISTVDADGTPCIWVYTDTNENSYIIQGEDLSVSRSYLSYQKTDSEGNPLYAFAEAYETDGNDLSCEYERISVSGDELQAVLDETENVVKNMENQKQ